MLWILLKFATFTSEKWWLKLLRGYSILIRYAVVIVIWILASLFLEHSVEYVTTSTFQFISLNWQEPCICRLEYKNLQMLFEYWHSQHPFCTICIYPRIKPVFCEAIWYYLQRYLTCIEIWKLQVASFVHHTKPKWKSMKRESKVALHEPHCVGPTQWPL